MATLGSLVVTLEANIAKFQSDLGKAVTVAESAMNKISNVVGVAGGAIAGLGAALTAVKIADFAKDVIESTASLQDMAARTGASVEALSAMKGIAEKSGTSLETVSASFAKLEKTAAAAVGGNVQAQRAFDAIGMSAADLAKGLKDPDAMFLEVAKRLEEFRDDGNKTAVLLALMGRGASENAAFFHQLADEGYANATASAEQAARAHELTDKLHDLDESVLKLTRDLLLDQGFPLLQTVKVGIVTLIYDFDVAYTTITYGWKIMLAELGAGWGRFATSVGNTMQILGRATGPLAPIFRQVGSALSAANWGKNDPAALKAERDAKLAASNAAMQAAVEDYAASQTPGVQLANHKRSAPTITQADRTGELKKSLESRLKVIQDAIKAEDAAEKLANTMLDADYANGLVSLADYSDQKSKILEDGFTLRQSLYDSEIAAIQAQLPALAAAGKAEEGLALIRAAADAKVADQNKHEQDRETLLKDLQAASEKYAKSLENLDKAYATVNGDTVTLAALQYQEQYGMLQLTAAANGNTDALMKLDAIQQDMALRAAKDPLSGMKVAIIDYSKSIQDVAKATQQITTNLFKGMEDALVQFAMTGKLSFKQMIDSFIADLIRLEIQKNIEQPILNFVGSLFGSSGSFGTASTGSTIGAGSVMDWAPGEASGGPVVAGMTYKIGEFGPETFTPKTDGVITPNGASGGGVVYAPVINVDARADRVQVQRDMAQIVQQGNSQLLSMLLRYNPYLRT